MDEKNQILIEISDQLEIDFFDDFKSSLSDFFSFKVDKSIEKYNYADGGQIHDIIIYFNQHQLDLILGYAFGKSFDLIFKGIYQLWKKLKERDSYGTKPKRISIKFLIDNKIAEFDLETNFSEKTAKKIFDTSFKQFSKEDLIKIISNPKYLSNSGDSGYSKFKYNHITGLWVPFDYDKIRRDIRKSQEEEEQKTNN